MATFREDVEAGLLGLPCVRRLAEREARFIDDYKDGTFGLSYLGFLLYCNGRNPRGLSETNPNGLLYFDKENLFGIGVFRREHEKDKGHLMVVAPRGRDAVGAVEAFAKNAVEAAPQLRNQLLYARFLKEQQATELLPRGFHPVQKEPWHLEAFAEDETFNHSVIRLTDLFDFGEQGIDRLTSAHDKRKIRQAFLRFNSFLERCDVWWKTETFSSPEIAKEVVRDHFRMLESLGKKIGSVPEDYYNLLEASKKGRFARIMKMQKGSKEIVSSVFVGEKISEKRMALYCTISRRDPALYAKALNFVEQPIGFNALSTYSFLKAFEEIKKEFPEIEDVHLGGSETAELNAFKRRLGAKNEPTYWVVKKL